VAPANIDIFQAAARRKNRDGAGVATPDTKPGERTRADGDLTLSLAMTFVPDLMEVNGAPVGIAYGTTKARFVGGVKVGSRLRARGELLTADELDGQGIKITLRLTVEIEGRIRPACVFDSVHLYYAL
jgi:acyl dehydratase